MLPPLLNNQKGGGGGGSIFIFTPLTLAKDTLQK